jgi:hypothetical protein
VQEKDRLARSGAKVYVASSALAPAGGAVGQGPGQGHPAAYNGGHHGAWEDTSLLAGDGLRTRADAMSKELSVVHAAAKTGAWRQGAL